MIDLKHPLFVASILANEFFKKLSITLYCLSLITLPNILNAQNDDIERDLKVMEAILNEIVKSELEDNSRHFPNKLEGAKASYIEGYGILVKIPAMRSSIFAVENIITVNDNPDGKIIISGQGQNANTATKVENDSELIEKIENVMHTFLVNYGDIVRDLPDNEKIIMLYKNRKREHFLVLDDKKALNLDSNSKDSAAISQFSVEVLKSDINLFKDGKINEETFWNEKVKKKRVSERNDKKGKLEYNVLGKIFESRLSSTKSLPELEGRDNLIVMSFHNESKVDYEVVSGMGIVYNLYLDMPLSIPNISVKISNKDRKKLEELAEESEDWFTDKDEYLKDVFENLGESIKEDMISYGRTLRSLPADELLIVELQLPKCFECDLAGTYQLSVSKAVLDAYDKREIDLEEAMEKITVKQKGMARDKSDYHGFFYNWRE